MTVPRVWHSATLLPNGKVLLVGRDSAAGDDRTAELYDPATGRFSRTGDTVSAQYAAAATLLTNGKVLIAGGTTPRSGNSVEVSTPELYDPLTGMFATTGTFVGPGDGFYIRGGPNSPAVTLMSDGRVLFAAEPFLGSMQKGREGHTATLLSDGRVLLAGGVFYQDVRIAATSGLVRAPRAQTAYWRASDPTSRIPLPTDSSQIRAITGGPARLSRRLTEKRSRQPIQTSGRL